MISDQIDVEECHLHIVEDDVILKLDSVPGPVVFVRSK